MCEYVKEDLHFKLISKFFIFSYFFPEIYVEGFFL
jgi:hypothetical protein